MRYLLLIGVTNRGQQLLPRGVSGREPVEANRQTQPAFGRSAGQTCVHGHRCAGLPGEVPVETQAKECARVCVSGPV